MFEKLWNARYEFARYFIIGISAFVADVGSLYLLKTYAHTSATVAVVINQPILVNLVFYLNKRWSFKAGGLAHRQIIKFYLLALANYLISIVWMHFFHDFIGGQYLVVRTANIACAVGWNFLLYKYWVYAVPATPASTP